MTTIINTLNNEQKEFIKIENHDKGRRYVLALVDTEEGEIIMDYPREIIQAYNCESVLIKSIKAGSKEPKKPPYLSSDEEQTKILEVEKGD